MEEKKVTGVGDFPVERTDSVESFCGWSLLNPRKVFDRAPIKEIREKCLQSINPDLDDNVNWFAERVEAYCKIGDYETVCMLLRTLCQHQYSESQRIVDLMVDSIRFGMCNAYARNDIKDMLVILCGKLQHAKDLYNENTRKLFQEIIKKFYVHSIYGSEEESFRLISRILYIVTTVKDKSFVPILEEMDINKEELGHLMEYASVSKERVSFEGLKMVVLRHLKDK